MNGDVSGLTARACALCGAACAAPFRAPPAEGAPDLDLRPGEPTRSTQRSWLATCRHCGAVAPALGALDPAARDVVGSAGYRAASGPPGSVAFVRRAMICAALGDGAGQAEALLQAAWMGDDAPDGAEFAQDCRRRAAAIWPQQELSDRLRLLDILRRAGALADAARLADALAAEVADEAATAVLAFQRARIAAGDTGRQSMASALRPPAHTPHVAHGKRRPGLWRRWFGG